MTTVPHRNLRTIARAVAITLMGAGVLVATGDGFAQSYAGLYGWAVEHGLTGWKADSFPLLVDTFVAVGELGLFLLAIDGHRLTRSAMAWLDLLVPALVAASGWGASLVFNVGHVGAEGFATQATAAVPPLASMVGLLVLLRTLHRYVTQAETPEPAAAGLAEETPDPGPRETLSAADPMLSGARDRFAATLAGGAVPSVRAIRRELHVGHPRAVRIRAALAEA